jgi:DNA polymerase
MRSAITDIETRSAANLRDCGADIYAIHPTTDILCVVIAVADSEPLLWTPANPNPAVREAFAEIVRDPKNWELVSHNNGFDRPVYDNILVSRYAFPPIPLEVWRCSQRLALANAYPAELDQLAQALGLPYRKDPAARKAMLSVSRPKANRKRKAATVPLFDEDPTKLALVNERCMLDVITARAVWQSPKLKHLAEQERHYQLQDAIINGRGVRGDRAFITAARDLAIHERIAINLRLQELTAGNITSVDQTQRFIEAVNARGHNITSLTKGSVAQVLAGKPDDYVRQLLELRRRGARAAVRKFDRMLAYMSPIDDRMRGTLRMYGAGPGRWSGLGPQLQNLKKNEANLPLSVVDSIRTGDRTGIAQYGDPLSLLGDVSRAALCAALGMELKSGDFSAIESVVLAWYAGEKWKLLAYCEFQGTGNTQLEPYRVIARRMLQKAEDAEIDSAKRQLGKNGELSCGFGGSVGAWRRIVHHDPRTDEEIKAIIQQWRNAHPATRKFWSDLPRAIRVAIKTGQPILVAPAPQPPIIAAFADGNLTLTLPSGRSITYPDARFIPSRFEDAPPDIEFKDNARGQWKPYRGWFGTFVENVVQGTARDLLAAAIERFESRGIDVVFHCHDEVTVEVPAGSLSNEDFLDILLKLPDWATGLPIGGKVHSGAHYLAAPEPGKEAKPIEISIGGYDAAADEHESEREDDVVLEAAVDVFLDETRADIGPIDDPDLVEREDDEDYVARLAENVAPLTELVSLPMTPANKVSCPFHDDPEPSCMIYPDHFHCFGCGANGSRLDWLVHAEGMTESEAVTFIKDWPNAPAPAVRNGESAEDKLAFAKSVWKSAQPLRGSIAERYLDETRQIDTTKLPADIHRNLRFHPRCVFGSGAFLPCLIALMRDPLTGAPCGIQRSALEVGAGRVEKIDRRMLGRAGVVTIWPAGEQLVVGEGLETVLAAATRIPFAGSSLTPAWALLSNNTLGRFPIIARVERLVILVDNDEPGLAAAGECEARWKGAGRTVIALTPERKGADFNDLIMQSNNAAA